MTIAAVFVLAALVGVAVYAISLRRAPDQGAVDGIATAPPRLRETAPVGGEGRLFQGDEEREAEADAFAFLPREREASGGTPLRTRLIGVAGLVVLVAFSAVALAAGVWQLGHLVNQAIIDYLQK